MLVVFGGAGFLGRHVCDELRRRGHEVVSADVSPDTDYDCDLVDDQAVDHVVRDSGATTVINLAYLLADATETDPLRAAAVNLTGFANVLRSAVRSNVKRVVYASSTAVYGKQTDYGDRLVTEDDFAQSPLLYGAMKQCNEALANRVAATEGIGVVGLRVSALFGYGRKAGLSAVFNSIVEAGASGESLECHVSKDLESSLIHVQEVAVALADVASARQLRHSVYNTGGECWRAADFADMVAQVTGTPPAQFSSNPVSMPQVCQVDWSRLRNELGSVRQSVRQRVQQDVTNYRAPGG